MCDPAQLELARALTVLIYCGAGVCVLFAGALVAFLLKD